ncbi:class I adenylate-forming enzyme family protein [Oceanibacterium hippocampi]|uniref:Short-chain-fatty-acid--CoA ligase n=1 Tax=Oceanibacterium hippocampi TaxID=745714 RepID=A0A1Y5U005_9PROT|nr:AMP-binding protein [Oceanibacterium hippocampi]SLN72658.1 Short-chain-fatty-acid--CoA ligase [Oceanibacterium hippocampi]
MIDKPASMTSDRTIDHPDMEAGTAMPPTPGDSVDWRNSVFADAIDWAATVHGDREAVVCDGERITYRELAERVRAFARGLIEFGIEPGEHVCLWMSDRIEWMVARWAVPYAGAVLVPLNTRFRDADTGYILKQSDSVMLIVEDGFENISYFDILARLVADWQEQDPAGWQVGSLPRLRRVIGLGAELPGSMLRFADIEASGRALAGQDDELDRRRAAVRPSDIAQLLYTSGTTSLPKGAMVRHGALLQSNFGTVARLRLGPDDRFLAPVPLFTATGTGYTLSTLFAGGAFVIGRRFSPASFCRLLQDERITFTFFVDTMVRDLEDFEGLRDFDYSHLRTGAGGPLSPAGLCWVVEAFGATEMCNVYGMSETSNAIARSWWHEPLALRAETNGLPVDGVTVRIVDNDTGADLPPGKIGEIRVSGYTLMAGYYNRPEDTAETFDDKGWLRTGDLGELTPSGHLVYRGRLKEMIKPSGFNVATSEIEDFVNRFPGVGEAVVVGVPDRRLGEAAFVFVKARPGQTVEPAALIEYCRKHTASFKVPRHVRLVEAFPMTSSGKVRRLELKELARRLVEGEIAET